MLVLQEIDKDIQPSNLILNFSLFWVRLYNLPFGCRSDENISAITRGLVEVMEIEEDFQDLNPFRRIRVLVDCTKPLKQFQNISVKGDVTMKINVKYERLPHLCFLCGLMSHAEKDCSYVNDEDKEKGYGWGLDIRLLLEMGLVCLRRKLMHEIKKIIVLCKAKGYGGAYLQ